MSEMKTPLNLTSLVTKKTRRAKARLMQNFGKADRTTDELFEVYQLNFNRQQSTALNLQKHIKHYVQCMKELHEASKGLSQCLLEMHEKEWPKHDVFENNAYELDHINEDLEEKLKESVLVPLEQYLGQFAEMREKIAKRGRKLVDYDSQRHTFEALQQHQTSKQSHDADSNKLAKSRDQLEEARRVYESLNNELHDELPSLYDNRIPFIITVFQRLFSSKISYHNDNMSIQKSYLETVEHLARATERGSLNSITSAQMAAQISKQQQPTTTTVPGAASTTTTTTTTSTGAKTPVHHDSKLIGNNKSNGTNNTKTTTTTTAQPTEDQVENLKPADSVVTTKTTAPAAAASVTTTTTTTASAGSGDKPPVYLHKVRATYKYLAEDEDELSFEAGETIQVIEYDDPQEQEEGWLMGIKESTGQKGLFPANFTKEI